MQANYNQILNGDSYDKYCKKRVIIGINKYTLFYLILTVVYSVELNSTIKENRIIRYAAIGVLILQFLFIVISERKVKVSSYFFWSIIMLLIYTASVFWSAAREWSVQMVKNVIISALINNIALFITVDADKHKKLLLTALFSAFFNLFFIIFSVGIENVGRVRLGRDYEQLLLWDANYIGYTACFGIMLLFALIDNPNFFQKFIELILIAFCIFIILNSESRGALIVVISFLAVCYYLSGRGFEKMIRAIIIAATVVVLFWFIMNNQTLYSIIGFRIDNLFMTLLGKGFRENSTYSRMLMIQYGIEWFKQKPIFGYGIDAFRVLYYYRRGILYYAHNNYIELIVDTGIVGLIFYYRLHLEMVKKFSAAFSKTTDKKIVIYICILFSVLLSDIFGITYYSVLFQMITAIVYSYSRLISEK